MEVQSSFFFVDLFCLSGRPKQQKVAPEKYSENKFLHLNALISKRRSDLSENQKKLAIEAEADLRKKRVDLQKKIFNQIAAQKTAVNKKCQIPRLRPLW